MESLGKMFPEAHRDWVEVRHQVYLIAQARLIEFQKGWEGDECEKTDFSVAPYWLQFSSNDPVPVHDLEDFWRYLGGDE
jgi:hypothetical protein